MSDLPKKLCARGRAGFASLNDARYSHLRGRLVIKVDGVEISPEVMAAEAVAYDIDEGKVWMDLLGLSRPATIEALGAVTVELRNAG